ncbi:MAG: hypothetical protein N2B06_11260 [Clostridium sp.]
MDQSNNNIALSEKEIWNILGYSVPKQEVVYFCQIIILYIVIIVSLINLSVQNGDKNLWISLLSASIGYLLPNPTLQKQTIIIQRGSD